MCAWFSSEREGRPEPGEDGNEIRAGGSDGNSLSTGVGEASGRDSRRHTGHSLPGATLAVNRATFLSVLSALLTGGYGAFATAALREREQAGWPPYSRLALIRAEGATAEAPMRFLMSVCDLAQSASATVTVLGSAPAPMQRRGDRYRAQLLLQSGTPVALQSLLAAWISRLDELPESRKARWSVDVDPLELF